MATEMLRGNCYSLVVPHLASWYKVLGDFCVAKEDVKRAYGPWSVQIVCSDLFPTSPWVISPQDLLFFDLHAIYDLVIEGSKFCAFKAFLVQKSVFIRPY